MKVLDLVDPPLGSGRKLVAANLALFFAGACLCLSFMMTDPRRPHLWFFAVGLTMLRPFRAARPVTLLFTAIFLYEAVALGLLLAWATPLWVRLAAPLLVVAAAVTARPRARVRVPLSLGLGLWILMCLLGWRHQEGTLRCSDLARILAQKNVSIPVPTLPAERCSDGESFVIGRYPRRVWEAPEPGRMVVTTQFYQQFSHPGTPLPSRFTGSICEVNGEATRCFGEGTAQAIVDAGDRLYVAAYQQHRPGQRGVVYALAKSDPMQVLVERRFRDDSGELYVDPGADVAGVVFDQRTPLIPARASDLTTGPPLPVHFNPGDTRYDPSRGEGLFCFAAGPLVPDDGHAFAAVAFRGAPFRHRLLAPSSQYPSSWATLSWGCDWDPPSRRAFVSSANLGWLGVVDYDSGRYLARWFVGFGVRVVTWDAQRRVVYLGDFLRGEVFAVDPDSGRETARWFVGRFLRQIALSRDGRALLCTSSAGVVRVEL